jgi:sulfite reductase (NADPH) hemoprotein beta-component
MYQYDEIDQRIVDERVAQFRDQTRRFLAGKLGEDEFRALRLRNGLYIQRHAPMLRIAIPYGILSSPQLRKLASIARTYDRGYGHFSTRQNLQLNWPRLEDVPEILAELATVQMHAIQTSGNCVRNITTDHFAGIAPDEVVDSLVWSEILRQWSTFHPEFTYLPRKFKIAISGSPADRAATGVHDIGLIALRNDAGEIGFRVLVGGGLGRTPIVGHVIREFLPWRHLLTYIEAILRVYNRYGRRDNLQKARIKILVKERGPQAFREEVDAEWVHLENGPATLTEAEVERVAERFTRPQYETLSDEPVQTMGTGPGFGAWLKRNVHPHRVPGYAAVTLSLKKTGVPPGDLTDAQMEAVADLADRYSFGELRVTHEQNLVLADVRQRDLHELWSEARHVGLATPNIGLLTNIIACPGGISARSPMRAPPDRGSDPAQVRRPGLRVRHRRARPEHFGLHERMRPPPRRPHRNPRCRQERRGVVPGRDRRQPDAGPRRARRARPRGRAIVLRRGSAGRDRAADRGLPGAPRFGRGAFHRRRASHRRRTIQGAGIWRPW